ERALVFCRNAKKGGERGQVFSLPLSHLCRQRFEIQGCERRRLVLAHNFSVIGTAGGAGADCKCIHTSTVGCYHQDLGKNFLLTLVIRPDHFPQATARTSVRICCHCQTSVAAKQY